MASKNELRQARRQRIKNIIRASESSVENFLLKKRILKHQQSKFKGGI